MEQTKNMDLLITKMADPVLFKKICLLYDKKRIFKYRNKANVHNGTRKSKYRLFNESEECRKILDFVGHQDVTTVISKQETVAKACTEFSHGKFVKNYVHAAKRSHQMSDSFHKQRQDSKHSSSGSPSKHVSSVSDAIVPSKNVKERLGKDFSSKEKLSLKSTLENVVTLSSDSSEDETDLIQRSTLNKCKEITGRIKHTNKSVKSCIKNKPSEVSKGYVVTIKKKSKGKTVLQEAHISPQKELSKRGENELSVHSDSDAPCPNKKRTRKKCAKRNSFGTAPTRDHVLLKPGISTPYPQFSPVFQDVEQDDIITVSSDSPVSSDADTYEKVKAENSPKKSQVRKNKRKTSKRYPKSFLVNKPSNGSKTMFCKSNPKSIRNDSVDDSSDEDVCLLDSPTLSKSDAFPTTKVHTSSKLPCVKDRFILEKKSSMKKVKRSHKLHIPNSTTFEKCSSRVCSAEGNISLTLKNKSSENVEDYRYDQKCSSDCAESNENVDEPSFNSRKNYTEKLETTIIIKNRKKDNSEKLPNLKTLTGSKAFNSTNRNNSEDTILNCHSDISSDVSSDSNSNLASNELHSSSDEDVLFQGFYKAVDSCTSNKGYKSSETVSQKDTPFILQSSDLKNPSNAHKFDNDTMRGNANDNRSFARSNSGKSDSLGEIVGKSNLGKEVSRSYFIYSKPSEVKIKKFDLIPEPVNFKIPLLHEDERLDMPSKEQISRWKELGLCTVRRGRFTPEESKILKKNFRDFSIEYGINDPATIFGIHSDCKVDSTLRQFLKVKHFYLRLGKNLNDRTLRSVYYRARIIYHPYHSPNYNKWTSEEISKIKEIHKIYGRNWNKIGHVFRRPGENCRKAFYDFIKKGKI